MTAWTLSGGVFHSAAAVPATDRGFRYGMSVFETFVVRRGRLLFGAEHLRRLERACNAAEFCFPTDLPSALAALVTALTASDCPDGMLRLYVTAGDGGFAEPSASSQVRTYALFDRADFPSKDAVACGFRVGLLRAPVPCVLGGWKTGNYWPHVQALRDARRQGLDEVLLFNAGGGLVSAAMANVFLVLDGRLHTPADASGARDGVLREWVRARTGTELSLLAMDDVIRVEECFLTNSRLGVMPVREIDGRGLPSRETGETLARLYREEILDA